ncbi:hypothetical protein [Enteroscipio rubneri]|nr:hypothetical protein [Enteroscipio rubneri]
MMDFVSPFAIVFLVILALIFARSRKHTDFALALFAIVCIMDMNMISAPLVTISGQEISCSDIVLVLFVLFALSAAARDRVALNKLALLTALVLVIVFIGSLLFNFFFPYGKAIIASGTSWDMFVLGWATQSAQVIGERNLLVLARYTLFAFSGVLAVSLFKGDDFIRVGRWAVTVGKLHICYALFELFTKAFFGSNIASQLTSLLFADSHVYTTYIMRDSLVALWGLTREPSHFVLALGFFVIVFLLLKVSGRAPSEKMVWPALAVGLMCVSAASSTVVLLPILALFALALFQIKRRGFVRWLPICIVLVVLAAGVYVFAGTELGQSLPYFEKAHGVFVSIESAFRGDYFALRATMGSPRLISVVESIRTWAGAPLLGIGVGSINPFSGVFAQLANTGIVGFAAWLVYLRSLQGRAPARFSYLMLVFVVAGTMLFLGQEGSMYSFALLLIAPLSSYCLRSACINRNELEKRGTSKRLRPKSPKREKCSFDVELVHTASAAPRR